MRIQDELKELETLVKYDEAMLALRIGEAYEMWNNDKATKSDLFVLGLRYPEFLANQDLSGAEYDDAVYRACKRRDIYLQRLGFTFNMIMNSCKDLCGLA